ncbi:MAG: hypothetical protein L0H63_15520 [Nitrococcus sp.]|nr:hypothetical protein [Nitrococcus sp.]
MGKASRRKREAREWKQVALAQLGSKTMEPGIRVVTRHSGPKVSGALGDLIKPYVYGNMQIEEYRKLAAIGALAWNIAIAPDTMPDDSLQRLLVGAGASKEATLQGLIEELKKRKQQLFPDDRRIIVRTEVREQPDGSFYLVVAADAPDEAAAELAPLGLP